MAITGIYQVTVKHFGDTYQFLLHLAQERFEVFGSLKGPNGVCSLYKGTFCQSPHEKLPSTFVFRSAQVDDYVGITSPVTGEVTDLCPPGGYHEAGITFGGTVTGDELTGCFVLRDALAISVRGRRIAGQPVVNRTFRQDGIGGVNRYCPCTTGSCTHHGFCDSCHLFEFLHSGTRLDEEGNPTAGLPAMPPGENGVKLPMTPLCMMAQVGKVFGVDMTAPPPGEIHVGDEARPAHGPHHLTEEQTL